MVEEFTSGRRQGLALKYNPIPTGDRQVVDLEEGQVWLPNMQDPLQPHRLHAREAGPGKEEWVQIHTHCWRGGGCSNQEKPASSEGTAQPSLSGKADPMLPALLILQEKLETEWLTLNYNFKTVRSNKKIKISVHAQTARLQAPSGSKAPLIPEHSSKCCRPTLLSGEFCPRESFLGLL